jgi:hypothetical protein
VGFIGRLRIKALTASDIWLLLESAYLHDIGMVITYADKEELLKDRTFMDFLNSDSSPEAKSFLDILKTTSGNTSLSAKDALQITEKFNQIVAESFRKSHASRAEKIIKTPELIKLRSPRTTLISQRIWDMCAEICRLHGSSFEEVMQLPQKQNGIGNDFFHPRLIACLLRIGDLLDLDNNRFCPVMSCLTGHAPSSTKAHQDKHRAINKLLFDHNNIDITAYCKTPEGYDETRKWFDYIEEEINNQSRRWSEIKPSDKFPALPTVGKLDVGLEGWDLNGKERPKFNIASERALKILQGDNIYSGRNQVFRELLQNALDATLIRIWLSDFKKPGTAPTIEKLTAAAKKYPITITLEEEPNSNSDQYKYFKVTIKDLGIGFSSVDLKEFQTVGKASTERARHIIINEMPEFMKPTGSFGIGFQSIFTISNEITIKTTSALEYHRKEIKITTDVNRVPTVQIKDLDQKSVELYEPGTEIEFQIKAENPPRHSSTFYYIRDYLPPFDPLEGSKSDAVNFEISADINYWAYGPVPISLAIKDQKGDKQAYLNFGINSDFYLSKDEKIGLSNFSSIDDTTILHKETRRERVNFKWLGVYSTQSTWIEYDAHIFGYDASEIMPLSRDKILDNKANEINKKIKDAVCEYLESHPEKQDSYTDAFMELHGHINLMRWKVLKLKEHTLDEIINQEFITINTTGDDTIEITLDKKEKTAEIKCRKSDLHTNRTIALLLKCLPKNHFGAQLKDLRKIDETHSFYGYKIVFHRESIKKIDIETYTKPLLEILSEKSTKNPANFFYKRFLMPCPSEFEILAIDIAHIKRGFNDTILDEIPKVFDALVFPFTLEQGVWMKDDTDKFDKLIDLTFKHRKLKKTTKNEIRASYERYMSEIKGILPDE